MCLAIPGKIVELVADDLHFATVEVSGVRRRVNVDLVREDGLELGEWVLIHVGFAMSKVGEQEAAEQLAFLAELGEAQAAMEEIEGYSFGDAVRGDSEKKDEIQ